MFAIKTSQHIWKLNISFDPFEDDCLEDIYNDMPRLNNIKNISR